MKKHTVVLVLLVALIAVVPTFAKGDNDGDDLNVILLSGTPTTFTVEAGGGQLVATTTAMTNKGPVTITQIVDIMTGILLGENFSGVNEEHLLMTGTWDFGKGHTFSTDTRVFISPVIVTDECSELIPNDERIVITGGTRRFANAMGNIQMVVEPFCFDDAWGGVAEVTGVIEGLIVVPED